MTQQKALFRFSIILMGVLLLSAATLYALDLCRADRQSTEQNTGSSMLLRDVMSHQYSGALRIYITEPTSRYINQVSGQNYGFGFLGFAVNQSITLNYGDTLSDTVTFTNTGMTSNNLMAMAVMFNSEGHAASSGSGSPFTAHWVDAFAAAVPGAVGEDTATAPFTHKVFVEEGTATWCQYCPSVAATLHAIYHNGHHQMYYVAMVEDSVPEARARLLNDYNISGYPSTYFDGGRFVGVGAETDTTAYIYVINITGQRVVRDLFLQVELQYVDSTELTVIYKVAGRDLNQVPVASQPVTGCGLVRSGQLQELSTIVTDADGDQSYIRWAFGDGDSTDWLGPFNSGVQCITYHEWADTGTYDVSVLTKDDYEQSPTWSTKTVTVTQCSCGDSDGNRTINISDAVYLIAYIFSHGTAPGPCECSGTGSGLGDADGNGTVNISDAVFLIAYIFAHGDPPQCL